MEIENINTGYLSDSNSDKDNKFEEFLWKRAKTVAKKSIKTEKNSLIDIKKNLGVNHTVKNISDEIEEYMVDYLRTMEFSKDHSNEISLFLANGFKKLIKKDESNKEILYKLEQITII